MKKKLSTVYTVMAVIALCLYEGMIALAFAAAPRAKAAIDPNDANFINIGEIHTLYNENSTANVQALYNAISGESNTTLADITTLAATAGGYNAAAMRAHNDNKDIRVTFGGLVWNVVYLSQTSSELDPNGSRPILTLWLADGQGVPESTWSSGWYNDYSDRYGTSTLYPSYLYGTSYIRAVSLNNGGQYAKTADNRTGKVTGGVVMSDSVTPATDHIFAQYTVSSATKAVINDDEIITPSLVDWQKNGENAKTQFNWYYRLPNENWDDSATDSNDWYDARLNFGATDNRCYGVYANWNTDNLWLPSVTETCYGNSNPGLWGLSVNQRRGDGHSWLRSGDYDYAYGACFLYKSGEDHSSFDVGTTLVVRPALHINLTSTSLLTGQPVTASTTYTAGNKIPTIELNGVNTGDDVTPVLQWKINDGEWSDVTPDGTTVGDYTVKITGLTGADADKYAFTGKTEFTFVIHEDVYDFELPYIGSAYELDKVAPWYLPGMTITADEIRNAGNYEITVKQGTDEKPVTVTITPKQLVVSLTTGGWREGATPNLPECLYSGIVNNDEVTAIIKYYDADNNEITDWETAKPGQYTAKVAGLTGAHAANYTVAEETSATFNISAQVVKKDKNNLWLVWAIGGVVVIGALSGLFYVIAKRSRQKVDVEFTKKV